MCHWLNTELLKSFSTLDQVWLNTALHVVCGNAHLWYGVLFDPFSLINSTSCFWVLPLTEEFWIIKLNKQREGFWILLSITCIVLLKKRSPLLCLYLYLKEEPLVKRIALVLGSGWSNNRKNEWYSTQIFQNILHWSRLAIKNSSVSWWGP